MDIYLDNIIYSLQSAGGISNYWHEISAFLIKHQQHSANDQIHFIERYDAMKNLFRKELKIPVNSLIHERRMPVKVARYLPIGVKLQAGSIVHSSYYRTQVSPGIKQIVTVHDFTYEFYNKGLKKAIHAMQKKKALFAAEGIICISENTKSDMLELYPDLKRKNIVVIYNGASNLFYPVAEKDTSVNYVVFVGDRSGYKNFNFAVEFVKELKHTSLYIVGGGPLKKKEEELLVKLIPKRFRKFNSVSIHELNNIYNNARFLIYPSEYEGFGIPVMEAMKSGCPVIAFNNSSIPEIISTPDLMMEELSIDNALQISNYIDLNRDRIIKEGLKKSVDFTWDKCSASVLNFYKKINSL